VTFEVGVMLLFKPKKYMQGYKAQSTPNKGIYFNLTKSTFQELQ